MKDLNINDIIVDRAKMYLGQEEFRGNKGFKDPEFDTKLRTVGFEDGYAWCVLFTELVWREAYAHYDSTYDTQLQKLFDASVLKTWNNFLKSKEWATSISPKKGSIAIWQHYKNDKGTWMGHAAVVEDFNKKTLSTIDGNSNDDGSREGYKVVRKNRPFTFEQKSNGLNLLGFIHPNT